METNAGQTEMTKAPNQTKMVKGESKKVRVFALRDFKNNIDDKMVKPGEIVTVTDEQAKDLTKPMKGAYGFSGERQIADGDIKHHNLSRARLATKRDVLEAEAKAKGEELPPEDLAD